MKSRRANRQPQRHELESTAFAQGLPATRAAQLIVVRACWTAHASECGSSAASCGLEGGEQASAGGAEAEKRRRCRPANS